MAPLQSSSKRSTNALTDSLKIQTTAAGLLSTLIDYEEGKQQQNSISIKVNNNESLMRSIASADSKTAVDDTHNDDKKNDEDTNGIISDSSSRNGGIPSVASSGTGGAEASTWIFLIFYILSNNNLLRRLI